MKNMVAKFAEARANMQKLASALDNTQAGILEAFEPMLPAGSRIPFPQPAGGALCAQRTQSGAIYTSLSKLSVGALEAAICESPDLTEECDLEIEIMHRLGNASTRVQDFISWTARYLEEDPSGIRDGVTFREKVESLFNGMFVYGWKARGAVEDAERLKKLI